jgi:hypothetical protein
LSTNHLANVASPLFFAALLRFWARNRLFKQVLDHDESLRGANRLVIEPVPAAAGRRKQRGKQASTKVREVSTESSYNAVFLTLSPILCQRIRKYYHKISGEGAELPVHEPLLGVHGKGESDNASGDAAEQKDRKGKVEAEAEAEAMEAQTDHQRRAASLAYLRNQFGGSGKSGERAGGQSMLRASLLDMPDDSEEMETLRDSQMLASFTHVPKGGFPLFLTLREFVFMLDGTLRKPFFSHEANGSVPQHPDYIAESGAAVSVRTMVGLQCNNAC